MKKKFREKMAQKRRRRIDGLGKEVAQRRSNLEKRMLTQSSSDKSAMQSVNGQLNHSTTRSVVQSADQSNTHVIKIYDRKLCHYVFPR